MERELLSRGWAGRIDGEDGSGVSDVTADGVEMGMSVMEVCRNDISKCSRMRVRLCGMYLFLREADRSVLRPKWQVD